MFKLKTLLASALLAVSVSVSAQDAFSNRFIFNIEGMDRFNSSKDEILAKGRELLAINSQQSRIVKVIAGTHLIVEVTDARSLDDVKFVAERMRSMSEVEHVELDKELKSQSLTPTSFNDSGWSEQFYRFSGDGPIQGDTQLLDVIERFTPQSEGIVVGVIDSGLILRPDFDGRILSLRNYVRLTPDQEAPSGNADEECDGAFSHGTAVSSIILGNANNGSGVVGIASKAKMHFAKVGFCDGVVNMTGVMAAIQDMADYEENRPSVINLSLGAMSEKETIDCSPADQDLLAYAASRGITIVASAGNNGREYIAYPALCDGVISVGAMNTSGQYTSYTNLSDHLDISTYGGGVRPGFEEGDYPLMGGENGKEISYAAGTSFSSPVVAAVVAYAKKARPDLSAVNIVQALQSTADKEQKNGDFRCSRDNCYSLNASAFLTAIDSNVFPAKDGSNPLPINDPNSTQREIYTESGDIGFAEICSIAVVDGSDIKMSLVGSRRYCPYLTTEDEHDQTVIQAVKTLGEKGETFQVRISGLRSATSASQTVVYHTYQIGTNALVRIATAAEVDPITAFTNEGGGGALNLFGLVGLLVLLRRFRQRI